MNNIGTKLKELREDKGLTQNQMGKILCVDQRTISNWELGMRKPDIDTLIKIAVYFEISLEYFAE